MNLEIVMPSGAWGASPDDEYLDTCLRLIAVAFGDPNDWAEKYGAEVENGVFSMHPFCWCESEACPWCSHGAPNFHFKPSGFMLTWYKYIGRGTHCDGELPPDFLQRCLSSHPDSPSVESVAAKLAMRAEETQRRLDEMMRDVFLPPTEEE